MKEAPWLFSEKGNDSYVGVNLSVINDDESTSNALREKRVVRVFARYGWRVKFTGKHPVEEKLKIPKKKAKPAKVKAAVSKAKKKAKKAA
jgi:hypothetical protein